MRGKRPLGRPRRRWEDNISMNLPFFSFFFIFFYLPSILEVLSLREWRLSQWNPGKFKSSVILYLADMYRLTDVSKHRSAVFFRDKESMKNLNDPEVKALGTFETSTSIYQTTRRKIIENFHPFFFLLFQ